MTNVQRALIDNSADIEMFKGMTIPSSDKIPGPTTWAWLPGFCMYQSQLAISARYLLRWHSKERRDRILDQYPQRPPFLQGEWLSYPVRVELELDAAGRIGQEVFHCDFESGPWRS